MDGVIVINKEKNITSNDVVQRVKKILNVKKVGHAGTLDPLACGVLPILVNEGTKLSKYLINHNKTYIATIKLGEKKTTGDSEGKTIETSKVREYSLNEINNVLNSFLGIQKQIPPMYSAIKKNGKKLYEYAREGIEIQREPRTIEIYNISFISYFNDTIKFEAEVSKGTYMRVLCENIAEQLGTVGYMSNLLRTKVDKFCIENSIKVDELEKNNIKAFITLEKFFDDKDKIELNENELVQFLNGACIEKNLPNNVYRIYCSKFIGIGVVKENRLKRDIVSLKK